MSDTEQGSLEWIEARLGKVTSSRVSDVLARTKSGYSASRENYMAELVCERMTGAQYEHFVSKEMLWGTEQEPLARGEYEVEKGVFVDQVGFIAHPSIPMCGGSPDGLVSTDGIIEIKCPGTKTHIETIRSGKADSKYYAQFQWNLECTCREWCDFVSYDPRMPIGLTLFIVRVFRDEAFLENARAEVMKFLSELNDLEANLREIALRRMEAVA